MKAVYYDGKQAVYREDLPVPVPGEGESLLRILIADICSTDREILKGYRPDFRGVMGHEFVGEVVRSDGRPDLVGKMVVGELNRGCGKCIYCRTGREKHCLSRQVIGMSKDGCFAEYMTLADHLLHEVPEGLTAEKAVYTEPLAAAVEITKQVHIDPSLNAAVIGDGRLGYMIAQVLAQTGIRLTVIGRHPDKLARFAHFADVQLEETYYLPETDASRRILPNAQAAQTGRRTLRPLTAEECFEYVVDASGAESGIHLALGIVRKMGTVILKSTYAGSATIDLSQIPVGEITVVGSRCGPFEPALRLLQQGKVQFPPVELYPLEDFEAAFASRALKAGFAIGR
ncbi:MAG: alcohol dehydrogenase catalytic domain-containing protein [Lachnospiraceae bacterium]|nr:alcohol dehydrogenase catalytic domain-containing protein [Lachnospiraceae bacterium]